MSFKAGLSLMFAKVVLDNWKHLCPKGYCAVFPASVLQSPSLSCVLFLCHLFPSFPPSLPPVKSYNMFSFLTRKKVSGMFQQPSAVFKVRCSNTNGTTLSCFPPASILLLFSVFCCLFLFSLTPWCPGAAGPFLGPLFPGSAPLPRPPP